MWMPIMVFFYMTFEHSIVNMFLFPSGLLLGGNSPGRGLLPLERDPDRGRQPRRRPRLHRPDAVRDARADRAEARRPKRRRGRVVARCRLILRCGRASSQRRGPFAVTADMPRELKISVGQHSDKGRKETNQDFHGVLIPDGAAAQPRRASPSRWPTASARSDVSQVASRVRGEGLPRRLLLHLGSLVGEEVRAARARRRPIPGCIRRPAQPVPLRQGPRLRLHAERAGAASRPPRICSTSATRASIASAGNALEQLTNDHRVASSSRAELSRPRARRQSADRDRLPDAAGRAGRRVRARHRRRLRASSTRASSPKPINDGAGDLDAGGARDRRARRIARGSADNLTVQIVRIDGLPEARRARYSASSSRAAAAAAARSRGWCSTATASCASCMAQQPQPHLSRRRHRDRRDGRRSRPRRSICATTPPISSAS